VPASNTTFETNFALVAPRGVTFHSHRLWIHTGIEGEEAIDSTNESVEQAARYLASARVSLIAYGFATGSFYRGIDHDRELTRRISHASGLPAITAATAILEALRFLRVETISVATPYPEWNNDRLLTYLTAAGLRVLNLQGDPRPTNAAIDQPLWDQEPEEVLAFASRACRPETEALLCACTAWRSLEVADALEQGLGVPVVTANQAAIWASFRRIGIRKPIHGFGRLLSAPVDPESAPKNG
jgi:maleate cis-trans isomerase